jgi:hypothetical protein
MVVLKIELEPFEFRRRVLQEESINLLETTTNVPYDEQCEKRNGDGLRMHPASKK